MKIMTYKSATISFTGADGIRVSQPLALPIVLSIDKAPSRPITPGRFSVEAEVSLGDPEQVRRVLAAFADAAADRAETCARCAESHVAAADAWRRAERRAVVFGFPRHAKRCGAEIGDAEDRALWWRRLARHWRSVAESYRA